MVKFTTYKIQDAGCRHLGFLGYVKFKKISVAPHWMKIYASNFTE